MKILGKEAKASTSKWSLVEGTTKKLTQAMAAKATIVAHKSSYNDGYYVTVTINNEYVRFTADICCELHEGCRCNPETLRVYQLVNSEDGTIIERCFAAPL